MILLKFLFFLFLFFLIAVAMLVLGVGTSLFTTFRKFRKQQETYRRTQPDGNIVVDQRSAEEMQKKIIPEEEGEYVDYIEEN